MTGYLKLALMVVLATAILNGPSSAWVYSCPGTGSSAWEAGLWQEGFKTLGSDTPAANGTETELLPISHGFPPIAYDHTTTTAPNTPVEIVLRAADPDGDVIGFNINAAPSHGTVGFSTTDMVVYIPEPDFTGTDTFLFSAHDGYWDSSPATVSITVVQDQPSLCSHSFYGTVTIDGKPAPEYVTIIATGDGVIPNLTGNPVTTQEGGNYGAAGDPGNNLVVEGSILNGTPIRFSVNGLDAEVRDTATNGPWQSSCPFVAGGMTSLDIRVTSPVPPPDYVYMTALGMTISTPEGTITKTIRLEKNPALELAVTSGIFYIDFYAIGGHAFFGQPIFGRDATIGIYENGIPLSVKDNVWFGSSRVAYEYLANETRTFDIIVFVNDAPEIYEVRHLTVWTTPS